MRSYVFGLCLLITVFQSAEATTESVKEPAHLPAQPIQLLVYTSPGGLIDLTARRFAEIAQTYSDVPFVVVNRPGGGGVVAFEEALRRPADGYTVLAVTRSNISKMVSIEREDLLQGVDWLGYIMDNPHVLIARDAEFDLLQLTTQRWLGADIGGVKHVSAIKMAEKADIDMRWIPFSSGGQAVAALLGNMGDLYVGNPRDALTSTDLHIVAVAAQQRLDAFPDAPTFSELGINELEGELIWRGFAIKNGTPEHVRSWLESIIQQVSEDERWQSMWANDGVNLEYQGPVQFQQIVNADVAEFQYYIRAAGLSETQSGSAWLRPAWAIPLIMLTALLLHVSVIRSRPQRSGLFILIWGTATVIAAAVLLLDIPAATTIDPVGPRGTPLLWGSLLVIVNLSLWQSIRSQPDPLPATAGRFLLLRYFAIITAYLVIIPIIGYYLASAFAAPLLLHALQYRRRMAFVILPIAWILFSWLVFARTLAIQLPTGVIFL